MSEALPVTTLLDDVRRRDRRVIARALNLVEDTRADERARAAELLAALPAAERATGGHLIGLTGAPGAGKSTLAAALIRAWRADGRTVGVLAVDPSSPLTGGALLGDRLRMLQPEPDDGLFIRSLASRGECGGLSAMAAPMSWLLQEAFDIVLLETVGVGQSEVDVAELADSTCLVLAPGAGDVVQFLKAGVMEVPDVIVVNKADLGAPAQRTLNELHAAMPATGAASAWDPPALALSALEGRDIDALVSTLDAHMGRLRQQERVGTQRRRQRAVWVMKRLYEEFGRFGVNQLGGDDTVLESLTTGDTAPLVRHAEIRDQLLASWRQT